MELKLNLANESIDDLKKCVSIINQVISNKENGRPLQEGLDQFVTGSVPAPQPAPVQSAGPSVSVQKAKEQQELMKKVNISDILSGNLNV